MQEPTQEVQGKQQPRLHHLPRTLPIISPGLKSKIKNDLVLEDGDEQHDGEAGEHAQVLQQEVSQLAALVVLAVPVKHFRQLRTQSRSDGREQL